MSLHGMATTTHSLETNFDIEAFGLQKHRRALSTVESFAPKEWHVLRPDLGGHGVLVDVLIEKLLH